MCALQNLEQQGYECYLPILATERLRRGALVTGEESLFPRYFFIRLGQELFVKNWVPIRSTRGVSRLVSFGNKPARIPDALIEQLRTEAVARQAEPLFSLGDRGCLTEALLTGIEGMYQMTDGEARVIVLIELLSRPTTIRVSPTALRKVS